MASTLRKAAIGSAALLVLAGAVAVPAQAREGGAIAAGVLGGLAAGAIVGSAAANANNGYYAAPAYAAPAYAAPVYGAPAYGGGCYFTRQPVYDEEGYVVGHRRVRVCE